MVVPAESYQHDIRLQARQVLLEVDPSLVDDTRHAGVDHLNIADLRFFSIKRSSRQV